MNWLESFVDQSMTFTSWKKVEAKICQILKQNLEKKLLLDPVSRQILFQMLGNDYVNKYFSSFPNSPEILNKLQDQEKEQKNFELKDFLSFTVDNISQKKSSNDLKLQKDIDSFSKDVENLVDTDFEDSLAVKSKKHDKRNFQEMYLSEIINNEPSATENILLELQSHLGILSDKLRHSLWPSCISLKEKPKKKRNVEKLQDKFTKLYTQLKSSQNKGESSEILANVKKVYKKAKFLQTSDSEENIKATVMILSICNKYGRQFQSHYIYYAVVLQKIYLEESKENADHEYGMASMMTEKILKLCALNSDRCNKIANNVIRFLSETDKELIAQINNSLIKMSKSRKEDVTKNKSDVNEDSLPSLNYHSNEISFYIKNWISNAFVSILKPNALCFIWDLLFYHKWENKIFQDICIALFCLIKPWLILCKNESDLEKVFSDEPSFLYLLDIRKALMHIQRKSNILDISRMNRNIKNEFGPKEPEVKPETPAKIISPIKKPVATFIPWVPYNKAKVKDPNVSKSRVDFPFDFYLDSVRFMPDNSTLVKVTGKVLNMYLGKKDKSIKVQAYPELDSLWRCPHFKLKQTVNFESVPLNPDTVIMIRVYTVEQYTKKTFVLGSCLFGPFSNKHGKQAALHMGGHQIRVRHGIPNPDFNVEHMLASHMDDNAIIPGLTILLRVLPHSKEYISAPEYETGYYRSEVAKPNDSEQKLYKHYKASQNFADTVRDVAVVQLGQASVSDSALKQLIQQNLQKEGYDVEDFPYQRYVDYNKEHGMMVLVDKASGLPLFLEGRYLQCLVQVFPGEETKIGNGKNQVMSFVTEDLEIDSLQRAPDWSDEPKRVTPDYDDHGFILFSLYGLRPRFDPSNGKLLDKEGREPRFNLQHAIAWSALSCFNKGSVFAGVHHIPLLKGRPPDDIIEKLGYLPLDYICKKFKSQVKVFEAASIEISLWDGHFLYNECPPLSIHLDLLNISRNPGKYIKASEITSGVTAMDLLKQVLPNTSEFQNHKEQIIKLLKENFKNNLDESLTKFGYSAMI